MTVVYVYKPPEGGGHVAWSSANFHFSRIIYQRHLFLQSCDYRFAELLSARGSDSCYSYYCQHRLSFFHNVGVCIMDDDRYIIDLRDLELGFSVWQVSIIVTLNNTIQN
jgi:hypothetical protein